MPSPFTSPASATTWPEPSLVAPPSAEKLGVTVVRSTAPPSCGSPAPAGAASSASAANAKSIAVLNLGMGGGRPTRARTQLSSAAPAASQGAAALGVLTHGCVHE